MKRAIRISILMVGLVGTFIAAAVQQVPAADGGPLYSVPTETTKLSNNPATAVEPGAVGDRKVTKVTCRNCNLGQENRLAIFGLTRLILTRQPLFFAWLDSCARAF